MSGTLDWKDVEPHFSALAQRIDHLEDQISRLSAEAGLPYERSKAEVPEEVKEIARSGDTLGAMKRYRELTGGGAEEARAAIAGL